MTEVMIRGQLNRKLLDEVYARIDRAFVRGEENFTITINSPGGRTLPTLAFIERINSLESHGATFFVRILEAKSAACVLALSIGTKRQMASSSGISFHVGKVDPVIHTLGPSRREVEALVQRNLRGYTEKLTQVLEKFGVSKNPKMMETLHRTGWLKLSAEACLNLGIVSEIV